MLMQITVYKYPSKISVRIPFWGKLLFLAYIPNSDPKMVIFLKIPTPLPFKRLCVSLGIMTEYMFHPITGGYQ